jgi:purine-binding chemotaxis protein CheW
MKKGTGTVWERIHRELSDSDNRQRPGDAPDSRSLHDVWKKRAEELARPAQGTGESLIGEKIIILRVGKERYAFRVDEVEEVMRVPPITPVPCVPSHVIGVINRRGSILPLVDLKVFFGGQRGAESRESRVVVLSHGKLSLGLLVEAADQIVTLPADSIKPALKRGEGIHEEFCAGVITTGKKLMVLIDSSRLLHDDRMKVDKG